MKKIKLYIPFIFVAIFLLSCNKKNNEQQTNNDSIGYHFNDTIVKFGESPEIIAYRNFLHQIDSTDATSLQIAITKFKALFADKATSTCDSSFIIYQNFVDTIESKLNEKLINDTTDYSALFSGETAPDNIVKYQKTLNKNGFKISSSEGMAYIEQDRDLPVRELSHLLSAAMKEYLTEIATENKEGFAEDASITISPQKYIDRLIWYEKFMAANPGFVLIENCKNYKKAYLTYLITGIDNTPLFDDQDKFKLSAYHAKAYNYLANKYPDSETLKTIKPYWNAIKQKQKEEIKKIKKDYITKGLIYDL